jgi:hypothetical protein
MNFVELLAEEQHQSPCKYGNIVDGHACYCHHPDSARKCPIWKYYGEDLTKWHNNGDWDKVDWNDGCRFFEKV